MASDWRDSVYGTFAADFAEYPLKDLCDPVAGIQTGPFGSQLHKKDYVPIGTPIITVEHLGENRILHERMPRVSEADKARLSKYTLRIGDIVFSRVGSVDRRAIVRDEEDGWLFSGRCLRIRPNPVKIDAEFLSYFFGLPSFKEYIRAIAVGATMPSLNTQILSDIIIPHPVDLKEQRAIAHILSMLDDKIELNRRMNATLEAMARAIFKSWFVDFDPVRSKVEGRDSGLPKQITDIFPDRFEDSELGEIPAGWKVKPLGELLELAYGKALKASNRQPGGVPVYGSNGQIGWHNEKLVSGPGIVVGRKGNPGTVTWVHTDFFPIDTTFYVIPKKGCHSFHFLFHALQAHDLASLGADSAVPGLNRNLAYMDMNVIPSSCLLMKFDDIVHMLLERAHLSNEESRSLSSLRDTLLPKLISGELRVKDTELFVSEANL